MRESAVDIELRFTGLERENRVETAYIRSLRRRSTLDRNET